jgi:pyrimidine-nucleoside phosphorylase
LNIVNIIDKKRLNGELTKEEIDFFINEYTQGNIPDYQASSLLMAICINGMNSRETVDFTMAMANSGETLDLSDISEDIVDKHSTGGVGDKVTLILAPIIASLGIPVAKMSGRGLGITGGTIDKLESIPGYNVYLSTEQFKENVKKYGVSVIAQTGDLAPADKKLYALRDVTATVQSIPLIASSIMSKKIAAGAKHIVLDITCGKGAFMKDLNMARDLANIMTEIGRLSNRNTKCVITSMDQPLGFAIGNTLEIIEAINFLKGDMPKDLKEVILELGSQMIKASRNGEDIEENKKRILSAIESGIAFEKFKTLVSAQGGDVSYVEDVSKFEKAKYVLEFKSKTSGYIEEIDSHAIGEFCMDLGAGRKKKDDDINHKVGVILKKKIGDYVEVGDVLAVIHTDDDNISIDKLENAYRFSNESVEEPKAILG